MLRVLQPEPGRDVTEANKEKMWGEDEELDQREENLRLKERLRQKMRQVIREENDEDREIEEHYLRLEYMHENCTENDREIQVLLDEQRELLNILRMRKGEFADSWQKEVCKF